MAKELVPDLVQEQAEVKVSVPDLVQEELKSSQLFQVIAVFKRS